MFTRICPACNQTFTRKWRHICCSYSCAQSIRRNANRTERFLSKVDKNGPIMRDGLSACWNWVGMCNPVSKYGFCKFNNKLVGAHRVSYEIFKGPIDDGKWVLHHCDNKRCVNPDHLYVGTVVENVKDAVARGKLNPPIGARAWNAILNDETVKLIRYICASMRESHKAVANMAGVTRESVTRIMLRKSWKHI